MVLKHKLFRLCTLSFFLVIEYKAMAQGWVTDEVSKDNSGGIFSGILGFILLIGIIWFVGYVGDVIYENNTSFQTPCVLQTNCCTGRTSTIAGGFTLMSIGAMYLRIMSRHKW